MNYGSLSVLIAKFKADIRFIEEIIMRNFQGAEEFLKVYPCSDSNVRAPLFDSFYS